MAAWTLGDGARPIFSLKFSGPVRPDLVAMCNCLIIILLAISIALPYKVQLWTRPDPCRALINGHLPVSVLLVRLTQ